MYLDGFPLINWLILANMASLGNAGNVAVELAAAAVVVVLLVAFAVALVAADAALAPPCFAAFSAVDNIRVRACVSSCQYSRACITDTFTVCYHHLTQRRGRRSGVRVLSREVCHHVHVAL